LTQSALFDDLFCKQHNKYNSNNAVPIMLENKRIALLIDCDNVSHSHIEKVLEELTQYGTVNVRHAHGDFSSQNLSGWTLRLQDNAIRPMQQFAYVKGKNATDSAMIIDAMDLLYSKTVDAFALMTSDSDFTPLAMRILESGLPVYGFGDKKTPDAFSSACSTFIFNEKLSTPKKAKEENIIEKSTAKTLKDQSHIKLLSKSVSTAQDDTGWAYMGEVGRIMKNNRSFSVVNYGYTKLIDLIKATNLYETETRRGSAIYIRELKRK
jgi:uncharacterized protein (TIGR00288 family)